MKPTILLISMLLTSCLFAKDQELRTVSYVNINQYIGKWYAISALPQFFTRNCKAQTAEYEIVNEQTVSVLNTCLKKKGKTIIEGQAVVDNAATNAELIVTFNNFFTRLFKVEGDYNIIKLDPNYQFVTVGSRDRKSLWIMSRTPSMPKEIYEQYVRDAEEQNYPVKKLVESQF